jgi:hypothetical protein
MQLLGPNFKTTKMSRREYWDPKRTWYFGVGLVAYQDGGHWEEKGRKDQALVNQLIERGVAKDRIILLKNAEATLDKINEKLPGFLQQAEEGDTLILYFAGHGGVSERGSGLMYTYDFQEWTVPDIYYTVEKNFSGSNAMLFADCCYSGNLATDALNRAGRVAFGVMSSSSASKQSTGNWTFTNALIDGFRGKLSVDSDGDGLLSFAELGAHVAKEMAYVEGQLSTYVCTPGFNSALIIAPGLKKEHARVGEFVTATSARDGETYKGRIIGVRKGDSQFLVTYDGYEHDQDEWLDEGALEQFVPTEYEIDTRVTVSCDGDSEGDEEKGEVLKSGSVRAVRHGVHLIHYDDEDFVRDEWVSFDRIKLEE